MADPITWTAVAMTAVASGGAWLKIIMDQKRTNGKGNSLRPGKADICILRGEKMVKIETEQDGIKKDIQEIKEAVNEIRRAVVK
jgi:hypothetical protein